MNIDGYCILGVDREYNLTEPLLLQSMDKAGVDKAVIVPVDRFMAIYNREGNDFILRAAQVHKPRFIPACSVNPWYRDAATKELKRALEKGAQILVLHPFVQGFVANDEMVWPILDVVAAEKIPVYIHTGQPGNSTPWQIVDLAERYPSVDFIMGHSGATDFWNDIADSVTAVENIYIESSLVKPFIFLRYLEEVGKHRGIMGSSAPLNELSFEWEYMRKALLPEEWDDIYGSNLSRLLDKRGTR